MKLFDNLKKAQEKVDALQKQLESNPAVLPQMKKTKRDLSLDGISKQILAQRDSLRKNGFKEYEFIANRGCCDTCAALNGKHFMLSRMKIGVNAPPMHDGCRCSIAAYEDDEKYEKWLNSL